MSALIARCFLCNTTAPVATRIDPWGEAFHILAPHNGVAGKPCDGIDTCVPEDLVYEDTQHHRAMLAVQWMNTEGPCAHCMRVPRTKGDELCVQCRKIEARANAGPYDDEQDEEEERPE